MTDGPVMKQSWYPLFLASRQRIADATNEAIRTLNGAEPMPDMTTAERTAREFLAKYTALRFSAFYDRATADAVHIATHWRTSSLPHAARRFIRRMNKKKPTCRGLERASASLLNLAFANGSAYIGTDRPIDP